MLLRWWSNPCRLRSRSDRRPCSRPRSPCPATSRWSMPWTTRSRHRSIPHRPYPRPNLHLSRHSPAPQRERPPPRLPTIVASAVSRPSARWITCKRRKRSRADLLRELPNQALDRPLTERDVLPVVLELQLAFDLGVRRGRSISADLEPPSLRRPGGPSRGSNAMRHGIHGSTSVCRPPLTLPSRRGGSAAACRSRRGGARPQHLRSSTR